MIGFIVDNVLVGALEFGFVGGVGEHVSAAYAHCPIVGASMITVTRACDSCLVWSVVD